MPYNGDLRSREIAQKTYLERRRDLGLGCCRGLDGNSKQLLGADGRLSWAQAARKVNDAVWQVRELTSAVMEKH